LLICVYTLTATKLDEILIILILLLCAGGYKYAVKFIQRFSLKQVRWGLWIYAVINVMLPLMFNPNSRIWSIINTLSSARLFFGQVAYHDYAIPLFGQFVYQNGNGSIKPGEAYFFIDSSFVRALLMYGLVFFVVAMFYIISSIESNIKQRNYNLVIALILVLLSSAIDNHLWDMAFNIVFLGMFADVQSDNEIVGIENESNTK
jgi:Ca2+/H+ antiporter